MTEKIPLRDQMQAIDGKNRQYFQNLSHTQRRQISLYLLIKYAASVTGIPELQEWYLRSTNEYVNLGFFDLSAHPELQWLLLTTVSPGMGNQFHYWLWTQKKQNQKSCKFFQDLYPELRAEEIQILVQINSTEQVKQLARDLGWDDKKINQEL